MTILDLLKEDNIHPKKTGSKQGEQYQSSCPQCGGKDRFHAWPNQGQGGRWWCRQCNKSGNLHQYLMDFREMSYSESCEYLGFAPQKKNGNLANHSTHETSTYEETPSGLWQEKAMEFVAQSASALWRPESQEYLAYLYSRGLNEKTIQNHFLGWNEEDKNENGERWGIMDLEEPHPSLWLPRGIVIPCFLNGKIQRIKIRRWDNAQPKYAQVKSSSNIPMILGGNNKPIVVVEGELDALLIDQEAHDLVSTIAMGSASSKPKNSLIEWLNQAPLILVALDDDVAGRQAAWSWWLPYLPQAKRLPIVEGKDPGEAFQHGIDIRIWIKAGIELHTHEGEYTNLPPQRNYRLVPEEVSLEEALGDFPPNQLVYVLTYNSDEASNRSELKVLLLSRLHHPSIIIECHKINPSDVLQIQSLFHRLKCLLFYDAKLQIPLLHDLGLQIPEHFVDILIIEKLLTAGLREEDYSLHALSLKYLGKGFPSLPVNDTGAITPIGCQYLDREAQRIFDLAKPLVKLMNQTGLCDCANLECSLIPCVIQMERQGFLADKNRLLKLKINLTHSCRKLESLIHKETGSINLHSPNQIIDALEKITGQRLMDAKAETLMTIQDEYPVVKRIMRWRKMENLKNEANSVIEHIHPVTQRIHAHYNPLGTVTGRFSCKEPNMQGIPKVRAIRKCFIAPSNHCLVIADYSQIEMRILAEITKDERMIQAFKNNDDLHRLTASLILKKRIQDISVQERQAAKAINFGIAYGMGIKSLIASAYKTYGIRLSETEAQQYCYGFFEAYSSVKQWYERTKQSDCRESRTLLGRRRIWKEAAPFTELLNTPIQSTAADIVKTALVYLHNDFKGEDCFIIGCVHDEIIVETPTIWVEDVKSHLSFHMEKAGRIFVHNVPIKADISVGQSWADK